MTPRFQRVLFVAALSGLLSTGTLVAGVTAGAAVPLKAALSLTPRTSAVGQLVTAHVNRSTQPAGDRIKRITLRWGEVSGLYFRRVPVQGTPVEGLLVRAEWRSAPGERKDGRRAETGYAWLRGRSPGEARPRPGRCLYLPAGPGVVAGF